LYNSATGKMGEGFAFAGSKAYMATEIISVADVMDDLVAGYNRESFLRNLNSSHSKKKLKPERIAI